jgi:hypothetical protein
MDSMYLPIEASYNGLRTIDVKLFRYSWMDIQAAAKSKGSNQRFY